MYTLEEMSTPERLARHKRDWSQYAKEQVEIKIYDNDIYAFGSEIACLRLYYTFRYCEADKIKVDFSTNLGSWFFSMYK